VNTRVEQWIEAEMRRIDPAAYRATESSSAAAPI
jgi:1-acyl-sn-glycerol-3-phosphate acyltransferase